MPFKKKKKNPSNDPKVPNLNSESAALVQAINTDSDLQAIAQIGSDCLQSSLQR